MAHGLIDEFRIALNPLMLGGGTPLFKPGEKLKLKLLDTRTHSNGVARWWARRRCAFAHPTE